MLAELMFWFVFLSELSINPVYVFYMRCISDSINISYFHVCHSQLPQRTKYTAEAICVNPLLSGVLFLYPLFLYHRFSDVFMRYRYNNIDIILIFSQCSYSNIELLSVAVEAFMLFPEYF